MKPCLLKRAVAGLFGLAAGWNAFAADVKPQWEYADDGRDILAKPLAVPAAAIPDLGAFTIEATLRFDERTDYTFFPLFDCTVSETGFGLALTFMSDRGNQVYLMENGQRRFVSYAMADVKPGDVRTFVLTARKGWIVVYCNGVVQRRFMSRITPTPDPVTVGRIVDTHWGLGPSNFMSLVKPMKGVRLLSLKVWGSEREYYAPGESRDAVDGFICGDGWMLEAPVTPDATKPTLLYVGDSISDGYTPPIKRLASGKANLYHWTKCWREPSVVEPKQIAEVVACAKPDVIVFNNGLHSLHLTEDRFPDGEIVSAYRRLVSLFRAGAPKAKILYLNTTPNTALADADGKIVGLGPKNDAVLRLNRLASQAMASESVPVIDAYSVMAARIPEARGDGYHWKPVAYEALAGEVWRWVISTMSAGSLSAPLAFGMPPLMKTYAGEDVKSVSEWEAVRKPEILERVLSSMCGKRPKSAGRSPVSSSAAESDKEMVGYRASIVQRRATGQGRCFRFSPIQSREEFARRCDWIAKGTSLE